MVICLVVTVVCGWLVMSHLYNLRLLSVQTASMQPTFRPGDALIMRASSHAALLPGMVVSYRSSRNPNELITHRVVQVSASSFQTKGDALTSPDPVVRKSLTMGRVVAILPGFGKLLGWLSSWLGLVATIYIPVTILIAQEIGRLQQHYRRTAKYTLI